MTLFYDPAARKPKIWPIILFGIVPIALIVGLIYGSQGKVKESKMKKDAQSVDVFKQIDEGKLK